MVLSEARDITRNGHSLTLPPSLNITTYRTPNYSIYLTNFTIVLIVVSSRFIAVLTQYTVVKLKSAESEFAICRKIMKRKPNCKYLCRKLLHKASVRKNLCRKNHFFGPSIRKHLSHSFMSALIYILNG